MAPKKQQKPKEMFKPYDATAVPDVMPFPALARVATTKTEETAVPKLNQYQHSWIFDVTLRDADLPGLSKQAKAEFYKKVKNDVFEAKAFQHKAQPGDSEEEVCVPKLMAAWKRENQKAKTTRVADDGDSSDDEEDEGARVGLLRGYTKAGWLRAIQKVITNKRTAAKTRKPTKTDNTDLVAVVPALAMVKVFGLASYTRRDKFRGERHDEINAHSRTLLGPGNAGGKFRKAEAELWANEDQAKWESAAEADEDVDWEERQKLPMGAVQHMVNTLNAGRKFHPFLATMLMGWLNERGEIQFEWSEALPKGVVIEQRFEDKYPQLVSDSINTMYEWAKKGLQDYAAAHDGSPGQPAPVFPVSVEALDDMSPNMLYKVAFGDETQNIPWPTIATAPDRYYDVGKFDLVFSSSGLEGFKGTQWHLLGAALAVGAGDGSSGFFRKGSALAGGEEDAGLQCKDDEEVEDAHKAAEAEEARKEDEAEAARKEDEAEDTRKEDEAEAARKADEAEDTHKKDEVEAACKEDEAEDARKEDEAEAARKADEAEATRKEDEVEAARKEAGAEGVRRAVDPEEARKEDEAEAAHKETDAEGVCKTKVKKSRKRKAPEDGLEADEEAPEDWLYPKIQECFAQHGHCDREMAKAILADIDKEESFRGKNYAMSESGCYRIHKTLGLKGTQQQKNEPGAYDNVPQIITKLRPVYPNMGACSLVVLLRWEHRVKIPEKDVADILKQMEPEKVAARYGRRFKHWKYYGLYLHLGMDPYTGRLHWNKIWWTNRNTALVTSYYLGAVCQQNTMPLLTFSDTSHENNGIAKCHSTMCQRLDPSLCGTIQHKWFYDKMNIKSEISWGCLRRGWATGFEMLLDQGEIRGIIDFPRRDPIEIFLFCWLFVPYLQNELDVWTKRQNGSMRRAYKHKILPHGIPDEIHENPGKF
ncbi:hypothetical protein B0H14DRAFT_3465406 [Mycena olivaceomarginata]|nr:hypothetical protein B0H14DRAFT_3465406 [Mycena olivaceomarginata]